MKQPVPFGLFFQIDIEVHERHLKVTALLHLPPVPIDGVDGHRLGREMQKAEDDSNAELKGATPEGRVEKPPNERKIVAALAPHSGQDGDRLYRRCRSCVF
jgi:hypothetical protein